jgi:pyridoxine kinase
LIDRWLSGVKIVDMETLTQAIAALHTTYRVPHILITSVSLPAPVASPSLSVIGSTMTSAGNPRIFKVQVPKIDCYFSGTGDMFAALILIRLREAVSKTPGLGQIGAWLSPDDVNPTELPLAIATEKASASMQEVLIRTNKSRDEELEAFQSKVGGRYPGLHDDKISNRIITKASEVRLVRNMECLRNPQMGFRAENVDFKSN